MSRENFTALHDLIKNHPVFAPGLARRKQNSSVSQLMLLLHYLGHESMTAFSSRASYHIGYGTHYHHIKRVVKAICSLRDRVIAWPDEAERKQISARMNKNHDFPGCVMVGDGTLFPLAFKPRSHDAGDYHGRKYQYSITAFIMNDDNKRIRSYLAGWPGSGHDNCVFSRTTVCRNPDHHFSVGEYMIADSAVENTDFVVAAFKKPPLQQMPIMNEKFNTKLASPRISAEHTIGILKGRFPWLKSIRMLVTDNKKHMMRILRLIDCCVIIHNLMLDIETEVNPLHDVWIDEDGHLSDIDEDIHMSDDENVHHPKQYIRPIPKGSKNDTRRRQLQTYLEYKEYIF